MNPLTLVKRIQNLNSKEAALGISDNASWHVKYKDSAYVFVGGIPFDLTEGDLLAVFAQYGDIVDVNLVRDKGTGKSKGFAFIAYEDQRSTNLAVDNLNGAEILGRVIRVDHVSKYKKKEEEDKEAERQKREARGVCRAFQRGECNRGAGCKFSHDEQRAANTGWGPDDNKSSRWGHDKFEGSMKNGKQSAKLNGIPESDPHEPLRLGDKDARTYRGNGSEASTDRYHKRSESSSRDHESRRFEKRSDGKEEKDRKQDWDMQATDRRSKRQDFEPSSRGDGDRRDEKRSKRHESESYHRDDREGAERRSGYDRDSSSHRYRRSQEDQRHRTQRQ